MGRATPATIRELRVLVKRFAPTILCILETQVEGSRVENLSNSLGYNKSFAVNSSGRSGGLCVFWNDIIKLEVVGYSKYHIDAEIDGIGHTPSRVTFVYGEAQVQDRYKTWDTLRGIVSASSRPWMAMAIGDFNEVLHQHEHDGVGNRSQAQMDGFRDALDTVGLSDIGYRGNTWTFEKKVAGGSYTRVRLDRCVATAAWSMPFPDAELVHETAACSDHVHLLLNLGLHAPKVGPKTFKYECAWETHEGLPAVVGAAWGQDCDGTVEGVKQRLEVLSSDLTHWDKVVFGNVKNEIS